MKFVPTTRYGTRNNISEIERRAARESGGRLQVLQISIMGQIYNLVCPVYLLPTVGKAGQALIEEARRANGRDYINAQLTGKPLPSTYIRDTSYRTYTVISQANRQVSYPVLMIDNS